MLKIEVCCSPLMYPVYKNDDSIVVVIDILRATSAICTAFDRGVEKIIPVATIEEARRYKEQGYIVGAERGGETVEGFDFGNSPYNYMEKDLKGKTIVLSTTNGTQAIEISKDAYKVVIGSFANFSALCAWLKQQQRDVILLCAGYKNRFNLEDALFAGAVVDNLSTGMAAVELVDSALAHKYLYQTAKADPIKFVARSSHKRRMAKLNLKNDIRYCLTFDQTNVVPILQDGALVKLQPTLVEEAN